MADSPVDAARFVEGDFGVGRVLRRSASVLSRYFPAFLLVTGVANLPTLWLFEAVEPSLDAPGQLVALLSLGLVLLFVLSTLSQAVILYAAFQDMRGRPASFGKSLGVGLGRFLPIIGLAIISGVLIGLAGLLLLVPGLILLTMWFVGVPVCVVERLGPWASLKRSAELTRGHLWKIFGLMLLLLAVSAVASTLIELLVRPVVSPILTFLVALIWSAIWGAYYAIAIVVAYYDLRAAKEGIDIEQIAAVFD